MDEKTAANLRQFREHLRDALRAVYDLSKSDPSDPQVVEYQRKVIKRLERTVQRAQPILGQDSFHWVQLEGWYTLEGIEEFFRKTIPWSKTNNVRIVLADSTRELGEAVLPWACLNDDQWTLEGVEDFLHETIRKSAAARIQVTLLEAP